MLNIFKPTFISTATDTAIGTGNVFVHTICFPKATAGIVTLEQTDGTDYIALPVGTIGTLIFDSVFPSGLSVKTASADFLIVNSGQ